MKKKTIERIYLSKEEMLLVESDIRFQEHLRRYAAVRRFCYGSVLDFASGCGYGSYILASNPEVEKVVAVDIDKESIDWGKQQFSHSKIEFVNDDVRNLNQSFDTLVSLETIEHFKDLSIYKDIIKKCKFSQLIISFPDKKSTHFNPFHYQDFVLQDIIDLFPDYLAYHSFTMGDVQFILFIRLPEKAPSHIYRNIRDL